MFKLIRKYTLGERKVYQFTYIFQKQHVVFLKHFNGYEVHVLFSAFQRFYNGSTLFFSNGIDYNILGVSFNKFIRRELCFRLVSSKVFSYRNKVFVKDISNFVLIIIRDTIMRNRINIMIIIVFRKFFL